MEAHDHAVDMVIALNEAAQTLEELKSRTGIPDSDDLAAIHAIVLRSDRMGEEAAGRLRIDGKAGDTVTMGYDFAMDSAQELLTILTRSDDRRVLGCVARAYTFYLTAAAAALTYEKLMASRRSQAENDYLAYLKKEW